MDRFSSHEDAPSWSMSHFNAGREARLAGTDRGAAPKPADVGDDAHKSWLAGWIDAEMEILSDAELALQNGSLNPSAELSVDGLTTDPLESFRPAD